ncbi:MAG: tetratricopeptide repeat protein [Bacteroidia bacterium]
MRLWAQTHVADSLKILIGSEAADTNKVNHLNSLGVELWGNLDTAFICSQSARELSKEIGWEKGEGKSLYMLGVFSFDKGNYAEALGFNEEALTIWEKLEQEVPETEKREIKFLKARSMGEIGNAYYGMGNYPTALDNHFKALKLNEEVGFEKGIGNCLGNIGNIYSEQKDFQKALEYYKKSLKSGQKLDNKYDISIDLRNIAIVYNNMGNPGKSMEYAMLALAVSKNLNNHLEMANNLCCVGSAMQNQADSLINKGSSYEDVKELYAKARDYFSQSLKLDEQEGNQLGAAMNYSNIGQVYLTQKNYGEAEKYLNRSLALDSAMGSLSQIKNLHEGLSELYLQMGDYKRSLEHYKAYSAVKDSIFDEEKHKEITRHEMNYEFEKKEASMKADEEKRAALADADKKKQNIFILLISLVAIAIAIIAVIVARSLGITRKQKLIIEQQKELVEEQQRAVLDSIRYAKRIQQSLLPTEKYIDKSLDRLKKDKDKAS